MLEILQSTLRGWCGVSTVYTANRVDVLMSVLSPNLA